MSPLSRRRTLALTGTGLASALAGCLGTLESNGNESEPSQSADGTGELGSPADAVEVRVTSTPYPQFMATIVHVTVGATVTWVNEDGRHDVTSYHPDTHGPQRIPDEAEPWASSQLRLEGHTFERTFDVEGVYDYADTRHVCTSHEVAGGIGRVVVGWPNPETEPGLTDPQPALPTRVQTGIDGFNVETKPVLEAGP
ncbi:cupredoxin domain-containing protein [Natronosalvus vescus]|uniref:cupredoxin domain-containing protein n=1 Tax=Natronosalvus vescus TaxID=2953881 RepID=UPI002090E737|nr:plastocyanin/azurin family copper-binding protein [Natronosalvus vescus]